MKKDLSLISEMLLRCNTDDALRKIGESGDDKNIALSLLKLRAFYQKRWFGLALSECYILLDNVGGLDGFKQRHANLIVRCLIYSGEYKEAYQLISEALLSSQLDNREKVLLISLAIELDLKGVEHLVDIAGLNLAEAADKFSYDRLPLFKHRRIQAKFDRNYLFVTGSPRSGTTALGLFLEQFDRVALTIERYGFTQGFHPAMFEKAAVFFNEEYKKRYIKTYNKYSEAYYVGDKRPNFFHGWSLTSKNFSPKKVRIINVIREPYGVAESYEKRCAAQLAGNDAWASNSTMPRDAFMAVKEMNAHNRGLLKAICDGEYRNSVLCVDFSRLYSDHRYILDVLKWLDLNVSREIERKIHAFVDESSDRVLLGKRKISAKVEEEVNKNFDFLTYEEIRKRLFSNV